MWKKVKGLTKKVRGIFIRNLTAWGFKYLPTEANFIYIEIEENAFRLYDRLLKEG